MLCIDRILFLQKGLYVFGLFGGVLGRKTLENRKRKIFSAGGFVYGKGKTSSSSSSSLKLEPFADLFLALGIALAHI